MIESYHGLKITLSGNITVSFTSQILMPVLKIGIISVSGTCQMALFGGKCHTKTTHYLFPSSKTLIHK